MTLSFIAVVAVAFFATGALGIAVYAIRNAVAHNQIAIERTCEALNEGRAINNRDRLTLLRGIRSAEESAKTVTDATLKRLLLNSVANTRRELAVRPYLEKLPGCKAPVPFPPRTL